MNVGSMIRGLVDGDHPPSTVVLDPSVHEMLCDELISRDGRPSRVYCFAGIRIEIATHV